MISKRMAKFFATGALSFLCITAMAQNEADALRYSYLSPMGTARSMGFGGALGSIGGDFTGLSVNPASIGIYKVSEGSLTTALKMNHTNSTYAGTSNQTSTFNDGSTRLNFDNLGLVYCMHEEQEYSGKWKTINWGLGVNRLADFTRNYYYQGYNNTSSASEPMVVSANADRSSYTYGNFTPGSLGELGYKAYLVDTGAVFGAGSNSYGTIVDWSKGVRQRKMVSERGGVNEIVQSFGFNYDDKLLLGATVGIPIIRFHQEDSIAETNTLNPDQDRFFGSFGYKQSLTTKGTGINLKIGFIYKINDQFRIGAAIHTPTAYALHDSTYYEVTSDTRYLKSDYYGDSSGPYSSYTAVQEFRYNLTTPWRGLVSASVLLGGVGFITADAEYVDYSSMRYHMPDYKDYEQQINDRIKSTYRGAFNFRSGAEFRYDRMRFRAGFGYYGSPYKCSFSGADRYDISLGIGVRFDQCFLDIGYVHSMYSSGQVQPYSLPYANVTVPSATINNRNNNLAITLGVKL